MILAKQRITTRLPIALRSRATDIVSLPIRADLAAPAWLSCRQLMAVFFRAGLSFGGGPGIVAALEHELVRRRQVVSREDYLTTYAIARLVPSGTTLALAVAFGYRFQGWWGTVVALTALVLPPATLTVVLTAACFLVAHGSVLQVLSATVLPAALAFIVASTLKLGQDVFRPSWELVLATTTAGLVLTTTWHPLLILLGGGLLGLLVLRDRSGSAA